MSEVQQNDLDSAAMSGTDSDVVIVGAGVIGLAIGIALLEHKPGLNVTVLEKESTIGRHASGRNSGVLHAGFYYSPDSLKAKFCRDGNFELRDLCRRHGIPVHEIGKVVVARDAEEDARLDQLASRGQSNGVDLIVLPAEQLPNYEPNAVTHQRFLWSPNTAISDSDLVIQALLTEFQAKGGRLVTSARVEMQESNGEVRVAGHPSKLFINAAGAQSDRLARKLGLAKQYAMLPFMGIYRAVPKAKLPLARLVYPVPHPINPFLGVHFTLTTSGQVKIGPTAIPILGREQYGMLTGWSAADIGQAALAATALIKGEAHSILGIAKSELPKLIPSLLVKEAAKLVPAVAEIRGWQRKPPGIRAQLVDRNSGELVQDFLVEEFQNSVHVLNAVSPGWTSALPFGRWVVENKLLAML